MRPAVRTSRSTTAKTPGSDRGRYRVALTGGKSGGHVFPALAVGEALEELGAELVYFGLAGQMEERLAAAHQIEFVPIRSRPMVGRGALRRTAAVAVVALSALRSALALRRRGVCAVLATGGFVAAPVALGARLVGRPVLLVEPNAVPGAANRALSRLARRAAIAYQATADRLRCPTVLTGTPVRAEFFAVAPLRTERSSGPLRLLVIGGSQGAAVLNRRLPRLLHGELGDLPLRIVHQCGAAHGESTRRGWAEELAAEPSDGVLQGGPLEVRVEPFIDDMVSALAEADLVISRAGAMALAELCAAGRPSVLVPLRLAGGHQRDNARHLEEAGAARTVAEEELESLPATLRPLLTEPQRLAAMGASARGLARPDAARRIAEATLDLCGRRAA